jgi:hemerythrin-like domain-containing protein
MKGHKMSHLIEELKREHMLIAEILSKARNLRISSEEGKDALMSLKSILLAHIQKEDEQLYPVLRKAAEKDEYLKSTLDLFAKDMDVISQTIRDFFENFTEGKLGQNHAKVIGRFFATLSKRIRQEECVIYEKYDTLN